jgi:hypothetical protein
MKRKISFVKGLTVFSLLVMLFLGIYLYKSPDVLNGQNSNFMHTYLIKIPADANICPYVLMSKSHGRLHMIDNSNCTCPYAAHDTYLTTRCSDENSVLALFPSSLKSKLQIMVIDNFHNKIYPKSLQNQIHIAGL